jgi:hypothetical protein
MNRNPVNFSTNTPFLEASSGCRRFTLNNPTMTLSEHLGQDCAGLRLKTLPKPPNE